MNQVFGNSEVGLIRTALVSMGVLTVISLVSVAVYQPHASAETERETSKTVDGPEDDGNLDDYFQGATEEQMLLYRRLASVGPSETEKQEIRSVTARPAMHVYSTYLLRASEGDPQAQFVLGSVLESCKLTLDETVLEELDSTRIKESTAEWVRTNVERCSGLRTLVADVGELYELSFDWYEKAVENGSALAELRIFKTRGSVGISSKQDWLDALNRHVNLVVPALIDSRSDGFLKRSAISQAASVYEEFQTVGGLNSRGIDSAHLVYTRRIDSAAWSHLRCAYLPFSCHFPRYIERLEEEFYLYELEEIAERALELEAQINDGSLSTTMFR